MRKLIIIALVVLFHVTCLAQQESLYRHEVGLNISTLFIYAMGGETETPMFSLLYKRDRGNYGWRFSVNAKRDFNGLGVNGYPVEYNSFVIRETDTSQYRVENYYRERAYQWLSYGYEHRFGKRVQIFIGLDICAGTRKGRMEQQEAYYEDLTYYYSWGTLTDSLHFHSSSLRGETDAKFRYIGLEGVVGIRIPVTSRFYLTIQSGFDYYLNSGYYSYKDGAQQLLYDKFQYLGSHSDRLVNSVSFSYRYNSLRTARVKK